MPATSNPYFLLVAKRRSLQEFWVSHASAEQRKGRAGRTGPGLCFRLYARSTFDRLAPFAEPEIRRCPLEGLVLQMKSLGLDDPRYFPYLSPPPPENLRAALEALALLGATDAAAASSAAAPVLESPSKLTHSDAGRTVLHQPPDCNSDKAQPNLTQLAGVDLSSTAVFNAATARAPLTPLGRVLSSLPVDPSVGKMLALGALFGESEHVITLAAALSTQTPFDARATASASGANPVAEFASPDGGWGWVCGVTCGCWREFVFTLPSGPTSISPINRCFCRLENGAPFLLLGHRQNKRVMLSRYTCSTLFACARVCMLVHVFFCCCCGALFILVATGYPTLSRRRSVPPPFPPTVP